jgi:hypothetical protein
MSTLTVVFEDLNEADHTKDLGQSLHLNSTLEILWNNLMSK